MREQNYGFIDATMFAKAEMSRRQSKKMKVLDFKKVAEIIRDLKPKSIEAGLLTDWSYTSIMLYKEGHDIARELGGAYLGSIWATPAIIIKHQDGLEEEIECYVKQDKYDGDSLWTDEAKEILSKIGFDI